jgi:hypothetical protein
MQVLSDGPGGCQEAVCVFDVFIRCQRVLMRVQPCLMRVMAAWHQASFNPNLGILPTYGLKAKVKIQV